MIFSHTQISQFLRCPRSYRYRYLDGWQEKDTRAAMVFGRSFEKALAAYFCREDASAALFKEWNAHRDVPFEYKKGDSWDRLLHQGVHLLIPLHALPFRPVHQFMPGIYYRGVYKCLIKF